MDKIYSRKRFIIKPGSRKKQPNINSLDLKGKRKIIKIIVILLIAMLCYRTIMNYIDPIFESLCEQRVKSLATIITNQQSTIIMNKYQYDELYITEKDEEGNIIIITSNVVPVNNMISDLTENIQNEFNKTEKTTIEVPLGNLFGTYFLSGVGPSIPIKVSTAGTLDTQLKSEFISQGINQTLHRSYVEFSCNMKILTPLKNYSKTIVNQVLVAEHVIIGHIPDTYYNLEGMDSPDDTLNFIE